MSMVRLKTNNYLCTYGNKIVEISAKDKDEAVDKARKYYLNLFHEQIKGKEMEIMDIVDEENNINFWMPQHIIKIPSVIGIIE